MWNSVLLQLRAANDRPYDIITFFIREDIILRYPKVLEQKYILRTNQMRVD